MDSYPKFSDFSDEPKNLEGEKLRIDDIINKEILVMGFNISQSRYSKNNSGKYLTLQFKTDDDGKPFIIFTGSDVLIGQIERYKENIPFVTIIKKINRYYSFS